jgi:hypothetical protein
MIKNNKRKDLDIDIILSFLPLKFLNNKSNIFISL